MNVPDKRNNLSGHFFWIVLNAEHFLVQEGFIILYKNILS
jgi:hypothetical protein